ncbi:MAG: hypothetical protein B7Z55_07700 [Planctomycetales bacterium 12-60-4]|nr:MAG: hypothetical protein B7Z55_07700 [Planctomycetales bacterium 12-60-4]
MHAQGGHPGNTHFATVRRWTATVDGTVDIAGSLHHPSENGDGVRGRIVSSARGIVGEWAMHHATGETKVHAIPVRAGETLDFVTDCREHETSDSFVWTVKLTQHRADGTTQVFDSAADFRGPASSTDELPAQVQHAWKLALCRPPTDAEFGLALEFCAQQLAELHRTPRGVAAGSSVPRQVLVNVCQMLLNSNEFVYVD